MTSSLHVVAIVPACGGSERVPRNKLLEVGGKPMVVHASEHALAAQRVDEVIVRTDDDEIAAIAREAGAELVRRPAELANATATSESALSCALDAREGADPDLVVFLRATSPVRGEGDVDAAIELLLSEEADSLSSAHPENAHTWARGAGGSVSYDWRERRTEKDMGTQQRENGAIQFRPGLPRREGNRLGGTIAVHEMDWWSSFLLDEPEHGRLLGWILGVGR